MSTIFTAYDLNTYSGKTLQPLVAAQVTSAVNAYVESQTHRVWGETKQVTGRYNFGKNLWLRHMDLVSVDEITLGWPQLGSTSVIPANSYFFDTWGRITLFWQFLGGVPANSPYYRDYVSVTYTYGCVTVPDDLKEASLGIALQMYNWAVAGGKEIVANSVGTFHLEYAGAVRGANVGPTPWKDIAELNYRTILSYAMQKV